MFCYCFYDTGSTVFPTASNQPSRQSHTAAWLVCLSFFFCLRLLILVIINHNCYVVEMHVIYLRFVLFTACDHSSISLHCCFPYFLFCYQNSLNIYEIFNIVMNIRLPVPFLTNKSADCVKDRWSNLILMENFFPHILVIIPIA